jgi:hypothetical protein
MNEFKDRDISPDFALGILRAVQRNGHVLLSTSGWALTKGEYRMVSNDKFNTSVDFTARYRVADKISVYSDDHHMITRHEKFENVLSGKAKKIIDCLWVAIDMLPESEEFVIGTDPWSIIFTAEGDDDEPSCLYEIVKINEVSENVTMELLRNLPKISDKSMQETTYRIAVMDNGDHAWKVPYVGFSHICVLDDNTDTGYSVVESRSKDRWKDYGN